MQQRLRQLSQSTPYTPQQLLGQGGAGAVYAAHDRRTGGQVAMKVMLSPHPRGILRFKQEFRVMSQRHHPNLVRMYELGCADGHWYYTMELIEGQNLLDILLPDHDHDDLQTPTSSPTRLSPLHTPALQPARTRDDDPAPHEPSADGPACDLDALESMVSQLLDALEFLHSQGIVHRDLKPSNILVDLNGNVRLLDFGLAVEHTTPTGISLDGTVVGTPAYLSPEQCRGELATPASDMYALGCILFKLLSGQPPFPGDANATMLARITQPPPLIQRRVQRLPQRFAHVCNALLDPDPALRPTPAQVRDLLRLTSPTAITSNPTLPARSPDAPELVGRGAEQQALAALVQRAQRGALALGLIVGESGLGKSALARWTIDHAGAAGFLVLNGRCYEREQLPFTAFDAVLDATVLTLARLKPRQRVAIQRPLARLVELFPAFEMLDDGSTPDLTPLPHNPKAHYIEAASSLSAVFQHLQRAQPVLVVLDDLQWADAESIDLLLALVHALSDRRVFILALTRPEGVRPAHPTARLAAALDADADAATLRLDVLSHADALKTARALVHDPDLCERLAVLGAGNPFLTRRLAHLLQHLSPDHRAEVLEHAHDDQRLLAHLLDHVSADAQHLLNVAATAGGPIDADLLKTLSQLTPQAHQQALDQLLATQLLKTHSAAEDRYDLYHDRLRDAAYARQPPQARADLHRAFARAIEARAAQAASPTARGRDIEALVRHWSAAGERDRTHQSARAAAERAEAHLAFERAAALQRLALDHAPSDLPPETIAARWEHIGALHEHAGHNQRACDAYTHALTRWLALDTQPERHLAALRTRIKLARAQSNANQHQRARQTFNAAAAQLGITLNPTLPALLVLIFVFRSRTMLRNLLPPRPPTPLQTETLNLLNTVHEHTLFVWPTVALAARERTRLISRATGNPTTRFHTLLQEVFDRLLMSPPSPRNLTRADALINAAETLAHERDIPHAHALLQARRGLRWLFSDLDRSKLLFEDALSAFERGGLTNSADYANVQSQHLIALVTRGDHALAEQIYARYTQRTTQHHTIVTLNFHINLSKIHALCGDAARAEHHLQRARLLTDDQPESLLDYFQATVLQHTLNACGDFQAVLDLTRQYRNPRYNPPHPICFPRIMWAEQELHACLGLLRLRQLSPAQAHYARKLSRRLQKYTVLGYDAQGLAAAALLDHADNKPKRAIHTMHRALRRSATQCAPYNRWAVLTAADTLGLLTRDLQTELDAITQRCGYTLPTPALQA